MRPVPRIPPFDRPATYADLEKLPPELVAEIVDGALHASPRPAPRHAYASSGLGGWLIPPFHDGRGGPGGWVILDEPELHVGRHVLVPDLAGWRRSRMPALPETAYFTLTPDWICEVVSVLKGIYGLRPNGSLLELSTDLPIVIEIVDAAEKIDAFLPVVDEVVTEGLVTLEAVRVIKYASPDTR